MISNILRFDLLVGFKSKLSLMKLLLIEFGWFARWTIFRAFLEVKDLEKLITEEFGGDSDTLSMAGEVLARQGKGCSFFLCSILSRPFFWRKISDLNRTLWDFGSGRTLFFAWTLDMDFFSEAVVDDECMDFFRGWWMDDVYLMIWCSHSYILGNLPEFWSVSFFLRNFNFLRLPRRPRNGLPVSKIGNWLHDSFFLKPVLSKFKFSMYTGQKNWHALNGALISKFTGAKSSGMYRELMRLFLFLGKNLYYCEEASSESHFFVGYFKLGRANCHSQELVGVQFQYGKHVTCLPFPDVHSNAASRKLRISKMFISMFFWSSMIYLFQVPSFPLKSGFGKNFPTKGTSTGWPEKYGTREVSSP